MRFSASDMEELQRANDELRRLIGRPRGRDRMIRLSLAEILNDFHERLEALEDLVAKED